LTFLPYGFLLRELVKRDLGTRYSGSLLGFLWAFLQPLWQLLLFTFVFSTVLTVSLLGERTQSFGEFLFCGLLPWMALQEGVMRGTTAITDNASMVKKLSFPSWILALTVVLSALIHEGIALVVFVGALSIRGSLVWQGAPWLLVALVLQILLTLGLALLLSALQVFFRDVVQILGMVLSAWFYLTPIVYPISLVPGPFRDLIRWNPLTPLVELYRSALLGGGGPEPWSLLPLLLASATALLLGILVFQHLRPVLVDEI
jgi:ABC-type polysaccharide/polyol phosphate export permease